MERLVSRAEPITWGDLGRTFASHGIDLHDDDFNLVYKAFLDRKYTFDTPPPRSPANFKAYPPVDVERKALHKIACAIYEIEKERGLDGEKY